MFFITGLPRSRTAWFAFYFNQVPGVECVHEMLNICTSKEQFYQSMEVDGIVGNSDSGLFISDFQQRWPNAPVVIIERPLEDVRTSLRNIGLPVPHGLLERAQVRIDALDGFRVAFGDIDAKLKDIHEWLVPVPFDARVANDAIDINCQLKEITGSVEAYRVWEDS